MSHVGCVSGCQPGPHPQEMPSFCPLCLSAPPELPEASCPSTLTWVEGTQRALHCVATGVPAPAMACSKDGMEQQVGTELQVTRDHAGTYVCHATNALGTQNHNIMVHVECEWQHHRDHSQWGRPGERLQPKCPATHRGLHVGRYGPWELPRQSWGLVGRDPASSTHK